MTYNSSNGGGSCISEGSNKENLTNFMPSHNTKDQGILASAL